MKNLYFPKLFFGTMLLTVLMAFVSCVDDNDDTEAPFLEVSPTNLTFTTDGVPAEGSQSSFEISTNRHWTATVQDDKSWVTLSATEGDGSATIQVSIPEGINDEANIDIQISNKVGPLMSKTVTIKSGNIQPKVVIYHESVGSTAVTSPYPYVDAYTGWDKSGTGAASVTYSGQKASVRSSGLANTDAYPDASGPNVIFFGALPSDFVINKITLEPNQTNLKLTFGASYSYKAEGSSDYDNTFDTNKFTVSLSADGSTWTPVTYSKNKGDEATPYWVFATSDFTLKKAVSELYIKFTALAPSAIRLDDITLATGNGGQEIDLEGGSVVPPTTAIYHETVGNASVSSPYPYVDAYTGWSTTGSGASSVTYSGEKATVRSSGLANTGAYEGASGPNVVFFGTLPADFVINKITLPTGQTNLKLTFGASYSYKPEGGSYDNTFDASKFIVSLSANGTNWVPVEYTNNNGDQTNPYWVFATANFTLKQASPELYIKFTALAASAFRLDDITLAAGEGGNIIDLDSSIGTTPTILSVTPSSVNLPATGGTEVLNVEVANHGENTLSVDGLSEPLSATVEGNKITVTAQPNTGTSAIKQTLTISLTNGNSKTVPVSVAAQGSGNETVISLDLSNTANYPQDFPIAKAQMKSDPITFTFGGYEYTFAGGEDAGTGYYQAESSGSVYTLIGKFGAYIELPAIAGKKLTKVVASTREGASKNVDVAIVDNEFTEVAGGEAVKWAQDGGVLEYTYNLSGTSVNTKYRIFIANKYNAQFTKWELSYE